LVAYGIDCRELLLDGVVVDAPEMQAALFGA
jgi:hypothetical protein